MKIDSIVNFLLIAGVLQGFLFNGVTLSFRRKYGPVVLYLNLVVLFISLNNLQALLPEIGISSGSYFIKKLALPWYLFILPCFHEFLRHYLGVGQRVRGYLRPTLWLFLGEFLVRSGVIAYGMTLDRAASDALIEHYNVAEELLNICFSLTVFYLAFRLLFKGQELYRDFLKYDDVRWIKIFMALGIAVCIMWCIGLALRSVKGFEDPSIYYPLRLSDSLLLYWIGYQGLYRYHIVHDRILLRRSLKTAASRPAGKSRQPDRGLEEKHAREFDRVREYISANDRFLDPLLGLNSLAEEMNVSPGHLSRLINAHGSQSFNDFINGFRVLQAKEWLSNPDFAPYTVVAIGLECGFNSKSTFYAAFKKFTALTPTEYRDQKKVSPEI